VVGYGGGKWGLEGQASREKRGTFLFFLFSLGRSFGSEKGMFPFPLVAKRECSLFRFPLEIFQKLLDYGGGYGSIGGMEDRRYKKYRA